MSVNLNTNLNEIVRAIFEDFYEQNMRPNLQMLSDRLGVSYFQLIKWKNKKIEMSHQNLLKIINYIHEKKSA